MSEHLFARSADPAQFSRQLIARAAHLAVALAGVIEGHGSADSGAGRAAAFLRDWAGAGQPGSASPAMEPLLPLLGQPLDRVSDAFGLSQLERDLLLLSGLPEEHEGLASTFRALHPYGEPQLSAGLAALVLAESGVDRIQVRSVLAGGAAVRSGLLRLAGPGGLFERSVRLADGLWDALHGVDVVPHGRAAVVATGVVPGLDGWLAEPQIRRSARVLRDRRAVTLLVADADESTALSRCAALAAAAGATMLAVRLDPADAPAIALLTVHAAARGAVPVVVVSPSPDGPGAVLLALGDVPFPVIVCARTGTVSLGPDRPVLVLPIPPVAVADRRTAWRAALPWLDDAGAAELAARHPIDPAQIAQVGMDAQAGLGTCAPLDPDDAVTPEDAGGPSGTAMVTGLIRRRCGIALPTGVTLATPHVPWPRLVLPETAALQLRDAVSRLTLQSVVLDDWGMRELARATRGARLLFTGPPGTGKSLAAAVVATAAATDLLRVDVSQLVSKWIGETEKNLAGAFDVAERTQAVLLLDEADALFGTRTQISDAHDRYANQETAYLLQRLDDFEGLVVLTTNLRHNIDQAFLRRLDFVVDFPLPGLDGRRDLWALHLPADQVDADVDLEVLARLYPIPGGWIRNAAVAAAFVAAATGDRIRQAHLVASVRREYEKAPLPFPGEPPRRRDDM